MLLVMIVCCCVVFWWLVGAGFFATHFLVRDQGLRFHCLLYSAAGGYTTTTIRSADGLRLAVFAAAVATESVGHRRNYIGYTVMGRVKHV